MFELKTLSPEAIPAALDKAVRYRLLNEPAQAESICLDVLEVDSNHQNALITLLLAYSDQFEERLVELFQRAREIAGQLDDPYSSAYYGAIVCERRGHCHIRRGGPGAGAMAYDWYRQAMQGYERAAELRPAGNDDAILRWNTCVRVLDRNPDLVESPEPEFTAFLE